MKVKTLKWFQTRAEEFWFSELTAKCIIWKYKLNCIILIRTSQKTMHPYSQMKLVNAVQANDRCLFSQACTRKSVHEYTLWAKLKSVLISKRVVLLRTIFQRYVISGVINTFQWHSFVYATIWKDAGSITDEVIGFFNWSNPSNRTMVLGSTRPPTEMSTRTLSAG
jgi:hypothetical protein